MERFNYDTSLTAHGGCYVCFSTDNLVSTSIIIEGEGLLALCGGCVNDLAVTAGFKVNAQDEFEALRAEVQMLNGINVELSEHADRVEAKLADLREQWVDAVEAHS